MITCVRGRQGEVWGAWDAKLRSTGNLKEAFLIVCSIKSEPGASAHWTRTWGSHWRQLVAEQPLTDPTLPQAETPPGTPASASRRWPLSPAAAARLRVWELRSGKSRFCHCTNSSDTRGPDTLEHNHQPAAAAAIVTKEIIFTLEASLLKLPGLHGLGPVFTTRIASWVKNMLLSIASLPPVVI